MKMKSKGVSSPSFTHLNAFLSVFSSFSSVVGGGGAVLKMTSFSLARRSRMIPTVRDQLTPPYILEQRATDSGSPHFYTRQVQALSYLSHQPPRRYVGGPLECAIPLDKYLLFGNSERQQTKSWVGYDRGKSQPWARTRWRSE